MSILQNKETVSPFDGRWASC